VLGCKLFVPGKSNRERDMAIPEHKNKDKLLSEVPVNQNTVGNLQNLSILTFSPLFIFVVF